MRSASSTVSSCSTAEEPTGSSRADFTPPQGTPTYPSGVLVLLVIAFLAGVITAISPCVLPVLPILLAGSAASTDRRRPYAIITGLVVSFTTFTLAGAALLSALGLPED